MTNRVFDITVLGGDGIGPEVTDQAVRLLQEIEPQLDGVQFAFSEHSAGVEEYQRSGDALPESVFEACRSSDVVLLGAMGCQTFVIQMERKSHPS